MQPAADMLSALAWMVSCRLLTIAIGFRAAGCASLFCRWPEEQAAR